jgi:hypothetical protein
MLREKHTNIHSRFARQRVNRTVHYEQFVKGEGMRGVLGWLAEQGAGPLEQRGRWEGTLARTLSDLDVGGGMSLFTHRAPIAVTPCNDKGGTAAPRSGHPCTRDTLAPS